MSAVGGPDIILDDLIYYIDFENKECYQDGQSYANNLWGPPDSSLTFFGSPDFQEDSVYLNGSSDYGYVTRTEDSSLKFSTHNFTACIWCKPDSSAS